MELSTTRFSPCQVKIEVFRRKPSTVISEFVSISVPRSLGMSLPVKPADSGKRSSFVKM